VVGLRDQINQKPVITATVVMGLIVLLGGWIFWQLAGGRPSAVSGVKLYFSSDDGHTWFADAAETPSPFDHDGSQAFRCYVFKSASGLTFAGYLEKDGTRDASMPPSGPGPMVKRPGDRNWVPELSPAGQKVADVKSPDGSAAPPQPVMP